MQLISPMQRYISRVTPKDIDGNVIDDTGKYESYTEADLNPLLAPCGGAKAGRVHFDSESGSTALISWKVYHPDDQGNCTISLGDSIDDQKYDVLYPLDGSGSRKTHGKFPCGRTA